MENITFEKVRIKNPKCYYFDDMIKSEDLDLDSIYQMENHMEIFWFVTFHIKL